MKNSFLVLPIALAISCLISIPAASAKAKPPKPTIKITKVTIPSTVQQGTATFSIRVEFTGNVAPKFPITLAYYPKACPNGCIINGGSFAPLFATFTKKVEVLSLKKITACQLVDSTPIFFNYAVSLKDARGTVAKPVSKGFTCVP